MSDVRHAVMDSNTSLYQAADAELAAKLTAPGMAVATPLERRQVEAAIAAARKQLADTFLERQRGFVVAAEAAWRAHTPAVLQRAAALDNPSRATAVKELARGASPAELQALATALVQARDGAGAYGLRLSLAGREIGDDVGDVVRVALQAGTAASQPKLRELVRCRSAWAQAVGAASGMTDPSAVLRAAEDARQLPTADGGSRRATEAELAAIVAD